MNQEEIEKIRLNHIPFVERVLAELDSCSNEIGSKLEGQKRYECYDLFISELVCGIISLYVKHLKDCNIMDNEDIKGWLVNLTVNLKRALHAIADVDIE